MKITYTVHAEMKIAKRGILKTYIETVLKSPDKLLDAKDGRKIAQKVVKKHLIRVVFEEDGNAYKVVTAYYSKPERYG